MLKLSDFKFQKVIKIQNMLIGEQKNIIDRSENKIDIFYDRKERDSATSISIKLIIEKSKCIIF